MINSECLSFDLDEVRGVGIFTYNTKSGIVIVEVSRPQGPHHEGWDRDAVLASRNRDEMIYDALFLNIHQAD